MIFSWRVLLNGMVFGVNKEKESKNVFSVMLLMPNSIEWHCASPRDGDDP